MSIRKKIPLNGGLVAPCYRRYPYSKTMDRTMAKTNIERFDEMSAAILAFLYEHFPRSEYLSPEVAGLTVVEYGPYDPDTGGNKVISGEVDPETPFFDSTISWLVEAGVLTMRENRHFSNTYTLTASTLKLLRRITNGESGETFGSRLSEAVKAGNKEASATILNHALADQHLDQ